jgi:hypothetical protein
MKTNRRKAGWLRGSVLLLCLAGALLIPQAATLAQGDYDFYYAHINSELGASYAQEYYNLAKGNYRYEPKLASYCVYAFANGFRVAYLHGSAHGQSVDNGSYASYGRQLNAAAEAAYNQNLSVVRSWVGMTSGAGRHEIEIALYAGWRSGFDRGKREKKTSVPPPTNADLRSYWSPGKSAGPIPSDDDPYGELRHRR